MPLLDWHNLKKMAKFKHIRRVNTERYIQNLHDVPKELLILPNDSLKADWLAFPLQTPNRLGLLTYLEDNNVQTRVTFAGNITRHPAFRQYLQPFPNADKIMGTGFLLGAHHGMTIDDVDYVCRLIKNHLFSGSPSSSKGSSEIREKDTLDY